jgi:hypothetical protein
LDDYLNPEEEAGRLVRRINCLTWSAPGSSFIRYAKDLQLTPPACVAADQLAP